MSRPLHAAEQRIPIISVSATTTTANAPRRGDNLETINDHQQQQDFIDEVAPGVLRGNTRSRHNNNSIRRSQHDNSNNNNISRAMSGNNVISAAAVPPGDRTLRISLHSLSSNTTSSAGGSGGTSPESVSVLHRPSAMPLAAEAELLPNQVRQRRHHDHHHHRHHHRHHHHQRQPSSDDSASRSGGGFVDGDTNNNVTTIAETTTGNNNHRRAGVVNSQSPSGVFFAGIRRERASPRQHQDGSASNINNDSNTGGVTAGLTTTSRLALFDAQLFDSSGNMLQPGQQSTSFDVVSRAGSDSNNNANNSISVVHARSVSGATATAATDTDESKRVGEKTFRNNNNSDRGATIGHVDNRIRGQYGKEGDDDDGGDSEEQNAVLVCLHSVYMWLFEFLYLDQLRETDSFNCIIRKIATAACFCLAPTWVVWGIWWLIEGAFSVAPATTTVGLSNTTSSSNNNHNDNRTACLVAASSIFVASGLVFSIFAYVRYSRTMPAALMTWGQMITMLVFAVISVGSPTFPTRSAACWCAMFSVVMCPHYFWPGLIGCFTAYFFGTHGLMSGSGLPYARLRVGTTSNETIASFPAFFGVDEQCRPLDPELLVMVLVDLMMYISGVWSLCMVRREHDRLQAHTLALAPIGRDVAVRLRRWNFDAVEDTLNSFEKKQQRQQDLQVLGAVGEHHFVRCLRMISQEIQGVARFVPRIGERLFLCSSLFFGSPLGSTASNTNNNNNQNQNLSRASSGASGLSLAQMFAQQQPSQQQQQQQVNSRSTPPRPATGPSSLFSSGQSATAAAAGGAGGDSAAAAASHAMNLLAAGAGELRSFDCISAIYVHVVDFEQMLEAECAAETAAQTTTAAATATRAIDTPSTSGGFFQSMMSPNNNNNNNGSSSSSSQQQNNHSFQFRPRPLSREQLEKFVAAVVDTLRLLGGVQVETDATTGAGTCFIFGAPTHNPAASTGNNSNKTNSQSNNSGGQHNQSQQQRPETPPIISGAVNHNNTSSAQAQQQHQQQSTTAAAAAPPNAEYGDPLSRRRRSSALSGASNYSQHSVFSNGNSQQSGGANNNNNNNISHTSAPFACVSPAQAALAACLAAMRVMVAARDAAIRVRVGVHKGHAFVGMLGSDETRFSAVAEGDAVRGARMCAVRCNRRVGPDSVIIVSEEVAHTAGLELERIRTLAAQHHSQHQHESAGAASPPSNVNTGVTVPASSSSLIPTSDSVLAFLPRLAVRDVGEVVSHDAALWRPTCDVASAACHNNLGRATFPMTRVASGSGSDLVNSNNNVPAAVTRRPSAADNDNNDNNGNHHHEFTEDGFVVVDDGVDVDGSGSSTIFRSSGERNAAAAAASAGNSRNANDSLRGSFEPGSFMELTSSLRRRKKFFFDRVYQLLGFQLPRGMRFGTDTHGHLCIVGPGGTIVSLSSSQQQHQQSVGRAGKHNRVVSAVGGGTSDSLRSSRSLGASRSFGTIIGSPIIGGVAVSGGAFVTNNVQQQQEQQQLVESNSADTPIMPAAGPSSGVAAAAVTVVTVAREDFLAMHTLEDDSNAVVELHGVTGDAQQQQQLQPQRRTNSDSNSGGNLAETQMSSSGGGLAIAFASTPPLSSNSIGNASETQQQQQSKAKREGGAKSFHHHHYYRPRVQFDDTTELLVNQVFSLCGPLLLDDSASELLRNLNVGRELYERAAYDEAAALFECLIAPLDPVELRESSPLALQGVGPQLVEALRDECITHANDGASGGAHPAPQIVMHFG